MNNNLEKSSTQSNEIFFSSNSSEASPRGLPTQLQFMELSDLDFITNIGSGTLAKVYLVKHKATHLPYSIKCISKGNLIKYNLINQIYNGLKCLTTISHLSIARLVSVWQDSTTLYLLSEYIPGGELFSLIKKNHGLTLEATHFYIFQIIKFFSKIHSKNIVYRDLKPENILISKNGYIKIIDFDYAKEITDNKTYTFVGTPEYISPEIIRLTGHNIMSDYWSLGVLIYECLTGVSPFLNDDPVYLYENILNCKYQLPKTMNSNVKDLIKQLFNLNPMNRMGGTSHCLYRIKSHPFITSITYDSKEFFCQSIKAPFVPELSDSFDYHYFNINNSINSANKMSSASSSEDIESEELLMEGSSGSDDKFKIFEDFNPNLTSSV